MIKFKSIDKELIGKIDFGDPFWLLLPQHGVDQMKFYFASRSPVLDGSVRLSYDTATESIVITIDNPRGVDMERRISVVDNEYLHIMHYIAVGLMAANVENIETLINSEAGVKYAEGVNAIINFIDSTAVYTHGGEAYSMEAYFGLVIDYGLHWYGLSDTDGLKKLHKYLIEEIIEYKKGGPSVVSRGIDCEISFLERNLNYRPVQASTPSTTLPGTNPSIPAPHSYDSDPRQLIYTADLNGLQRAESFISHIVSQLNTPSDEEPF